MEENKRGIKIKDWVGASLIRAEDKLEDVKLQFDNATQQGYITNLRHQYLDGYITEEKYKNEYKDYRYKYQNKRARLKKDIELLTNQVEFFRKWQEQLNEK